MAEGILDPLHHATELAGSTFGDTSTLDRQIYHLRDGKEAHSYRYKVDAIRQKQCPILPKD